MKSLITCGVIVVFSMMATETQLKANAPPPEIKAPQGVMIQSETQIDFYQKTPATYRCLAFHVPEMKFRYVATSDSRPKLQPTTYRLIGGMVLIADKTALPFRRARDAL